PNAYFSGRRVNSPYDQAVRSAASKSDLEASRDDDCSLGIDRVCSTRHSTLSRRIASSGAAAAGEGQGAEGVRGMVSPRGVVDATSPLGAAAPALWPLPAGRGAIPAYAVRLRAHAALCPSGADQSSAHIRSRLANDFAIRS